MSVEIQDHLSYSALSTYVECGQRFLIEKGYRHRSDTYWATILGSAFHVVTEAEDRLWAGEDGYLTDFTTEFDKALKEAAERGQKILASGEKLDTLAWRGGPNKKDEEWARTFGPQVLSAYRDWRAQCPWEILRLPDGRLGVELEFEVEFDGVAVIGTIDRVFYDRATDQVIIVDLKSGRKPKGNLQLADYAVALQQVYGIQADWGYFWYPVQPRTRTKEKVREPVLDEDGNHATYKTGAKAGELKYRTVTVDVESPAQIEGRTSSPVDLLAFTDGQVPANYAAAIRGIKSHVFNPNVQDFCERGCPVRQYCWAVAGNRAHEIPTVAEVKLVDRRRRVGVDDSAA